MNTVKKAIIFSAVFLSAALFFVLLIAISKEPAAPEPINYSLPKLSITTNEVDLNTLKNGDKNIKYPNNDLTIESDGQISEYHDVEIKGHGNSTWGMPKKPFQIKFIKNTDLFNIGKAKKWILLADMFDPTHLRNDIAFALAEMLEISNTKRGKHVELYINNEQEGLYYLTPKVEINKKTVNLKDELGILVELDNIHRDEEICYESYAGSCIIIKDAVLKKDDEALQKAISDFMSSYNQLEKQVVAGNFAGLDNIINLESFAKYYLVNEFAINPDAYSASFYMYKDGTDDKIHAGPIWDFDYAFGNPEWAIWLSSDSKTFLSPENTMIREREAFGKNGFEEDFSISKTFYYLMKMPEFSNIVNQIFQEKMSGRSQELLSNLKSTANSIRSAAIEDNARWGTSDFDVELDFLTDWIKKRYDYFEQIYSVK